VGLPAEAPNLTYWHWIKSSETGCHYDVVSIWVNNSVVESYGLCAGANTNGWSKQKLDLSAYAGRTVRLRVQLTTDSSITSSVFLDDLVFEAGQ
jgi:bacillopeptidase F (M6 metalloprotease family)